MEERNEQVGEKKKPNYSCGVVKITPRPPKSDEEIQQTLQEMHDAQFASDVMHMGRRGNIVIPMNYE